jgi:iron complex transport system permease protein
MPDAAPPGTRRTLQVFAVLTGALVGAVALALAMGAVTITPGEVVRVLSRHLGLPLGSEPPFRADAVLWNIRFPRIVLGLVVGSGLGITGAALQGVFRNPLADPHLLGIGPGASLGAVLAMVAFGNPTAVAIGGAVVGGVVAAVVLRRFSGDATPDPSRFVLSGVALGAVLTAFVGFAVFAADQASVPPVEFWLLGSLTAATWRTTAVVSVLTTIGAGAMLATGRSLDLMALGEAEARHLGVNVDLTVTLVLVAAGLVAGAGVGAVGVVGFVGLLAPHLLRRRLGSRHRPLLAASALCGAVLVVAADLVARTVAAPVEVPVGLVTAALGGPFFLWLLRRRLAGGSA